MWGEGRKDKKRHTYLVQTFVCRNHARGKHPLRLLLSAALDVLHLLLHHKIKRLIQRPIQPLHIPLLIRLRPSRHRLLDGNPILSGDLLTIFRHSHLRISNQLLHHLFPAGRMRAHQHLVVPRHPAARVIPTNVLGGHAVALLQLDAPVQVRGRVLLEVEVLAEGRRQPLVEPLLVEVEGFFKGGQVARQERGARQDHAGLDAVDLRRGRGGGVGAC